MAEVSGYSRLQIILHWAILLMIVLNYFTSGAMGAAWRGLRDGKDFYGTTAALHVWIGVAMFALVVLRLILRLTRGAPRCAGRHAAALPAWCASGASGDLCPDVRDSAAGIAAWSGGIGAAAEAHEVMFNLLHRCPSPCRGGGLPPGRPRDHLIARMMKAG